jgi:hypothetical protein
VGYANAAVVSICLLTAVFTPHFRAQSLADVAREEEARRRTIKNPSKVYTNKDLVPVPPPSAPSAAPATSDQGAKSSAGPQPAGDLEHVAAAPASVSAEPEKGKTKDQADWSGRMKALQLQLDRDRTLAEALQSRINALTADFTSRDDPVQRSLIGVDRQKALDELDRMRRSVVADQKALADFEEEARRASVPPGWLR